MADEDTPFDRFPPERESSSNLDIDDSRWRTAGSSGRVEGGASDDRPSVENEPGHGQEEGAGLFDDMMQADPIFEQKDILRPSYTPQELPHRDNQINDIATILASALRGETPSNILIYGKTGTGKTASAKYVSQELSASSDRYDVPCEVVYINCEVTDTKYRVLAQLANRFNQQNHEFIEDRLTELRALTDRARKDRDVLDSSPFRTIDEVLNRIDELRSDRESWEEVPMTGWPTDRVYSELFAAVDYRERVVIVIIDEIDKLVEKSGDDTLYNLSRMNSVLDRARLSITQL